MIDSTYLSERSPRSFDGVRWLIIGLIFFGTTINYIDRLVLSLVAPTLKHDYGITTEQYGYIGAAWAIAYAVGQIFAGAMLDKIGTRLGYALALFTWGICDAHIACGWIF